MKKIKENRSALGLYTLYGIVWFVMHLGCVRYGDDQLWVERAASIHSFGDLWNDYIDHISTWSSRFIIDFIGRFIELLPMIVWCFIDTVVILFLVYQLDRLFNKDNDIRFTFFIMSAWGLYPFLHLSSAGWMASTFTYLWPLAAILYAVRIGKKSLDGEKIYVWQYVLAVFTFIYGIDQQQIAVFAVLICTVVIIIQRKNLNPYLVSTLVIAYARLILHVKWPGNASRMLPSIQAWFPNFRTLTLLDKLQIGASTAFNMIFYSNDIVFLFSAVLLGILVFNKYSDWIHRSIILVPNVALFLWGPLKNVLTRYFMGISYLNDGYSDMYGMIHNGNYFAEKAYLTFFIWGISIICLLVSIVAVYGESKASVIYSAILIAGICSRVTMGFSPTVAGSGTRPYLFMYFSFIILLIAFAKKIKSDDIKHVNWILGFICIWGVLNLLELSIRIPLVS